MTPPLTGIRVVEFEGIGPAPLAGRMLADMGAEVTVITRPGQGAVTERLGGSADNPLRRGKSVVTLDLKQPAGAAEAMALVAKADAMIEGNRPGVMEKLGLGPAHCAAHNPRIVYGRMTGWGQQGQQGPLAQAAGHDLNYVALTGRRDPPFFSQGGRGLPCNLHCAALSACKNVAPKRQTRVRAAEANDCLWLAQTQPHGLRHRRSTPI